MNISSYLRKCQLNISAAATEVVGETVLPSAPVARLHSRVACPLETWTSTETARRLHHSALREATAASTRDRYCEIGHLRCVVR